VETTILLVLLLQDFGSFRNCDVSCRSSFCGSVLLRGKKYLVLLLRESYQGVQEVISDILLVILYNLF
jgi:hypothetical protein